MPKKRDRPEDAWELESDDASELTLEQLKDMPPFKQTKNEAGDAATINFSVPPFLIMQVIKIQEKRGLPYRNRAEVCRDAFYIGMFVITDRYKADKSWHTFATMSQIAEELTQIDQARAQIRSVEHSIDGMMRDGDIPEAVKSLERYVNTMTELDNPYMRKKLFRYLSNSRILMDTVKHCRSAIQHIVKQEGGLE